MISTHSAEDRPRAEDSVLRRHIDGTGSIWAAIAVVLVAVIAGTGLFDLAFLAMSALTAVPAIFVALLLITRG